MNNHILIVSRYRDSIIQKYYEKIIKKLEKYQFYIFVKTLNKDDDVWIMIV